jgi:hypothetical protein
MFVNVIVISQMEKGKRLRTDKLPLGCSGNILGDLLKRTIIGGWRS